MEGLPVGAEKGGSRDLGEDDRKVRRYEGAIKASGKWLTTEPFFMALLFLHYRRIRSLEGEAERLRAPRRRNGKDILDNR